MMEPISLDDAPVLEFIAKDDGKNSSSSSSGAATTPSQTISPAAANTPAAAALIPPPTESAVAASIPVVLSNLPVVSAEPDVVYAAVGSNAIVASSASSPASTTSSPSRLAVAANNKRLALNRTRKPHPRTLEVIVENVECVQSEAALRHCLLSLRGVQETRIDPISNTVFVDYDRHDLSSPAILSVLRHAAFTPVRSALQGWNSGTAVPSLLSQITLEVPWVFRSTNGWTLMQNHLLAQDGVGSCVFNAGGSEATVSFQAQVIGARQLLSYASRAGAECKLVPATTSGHTQSSGAGDWRVMALVAVALGTAPFLPPSWYLLGLPCAVWLQLGLCVCAAGSHGVTHLRTAWAAACARNFTAYLALVLSNALLFFCSVLLLPALLWLGRQNAVYGAAIACLQFDTVAWLLLVWAVGMRVGRRLKNYLYAPLKGLERVLQRRGHARLLNKNGQATATSALEACLVQVGDSLLFKTGDRVWCDGTALSARATVKLPPLLGGDEGPYEPQPGSAVFAGSLVMRGELVVRVTETDNSQLAQAALKARKGNLRPVARQRWLQRHAALTGALSFLLGVAVAFRSLWAPSLAQLLAVPWVSPEVYAAAPAAQRFLSLMALLRAVCCASAAWLATMGLAANSATAAAPTATAGLCASEAGGVLNNCEALERMGRTRRLVLTRSVLTQRQQARVTSLVVCPLACHAVLSAANNQDLMTPPLDSPTAASAPTTGLLLETRDKQHLSSVQKDRIVPGCEEAAATLIFKLLAHLESGVERDGTGGWLAPLLRQTAAAATGVHEPPPQPGTVRAFVGKGIEGQPPTVFATASFGTAPAEGGGTAAAGSLDFIAGCHQYAFNAALGVASKVAPREEWGTLQRWAEAALHRGERPILVALNGRPLGAVLVEAPISPLAKPVLAYLEHQLGVQAHVCSSASALCAGALAQMTGLPSERLVCGASQNDKVKFVEDLLRQRRAGALTVVSTDAGFLDAVEALPEAQGGAAAAVLTGELPSTSLRRKVDVVVPAQSLVNLLNLLYIARMARQVSGACKALGTAAYVGALIWCAMQPLEGWTLSPLWGLCLAFLADWLVLAVAASLTALEPARLLRYTVTPLEADLEAAGGSGNAGEQNSVHLVYPVHTSLRKLLMALVKRAGWRFGGTLGMLLISRRIGHEPAWLADPDLADDTELKRVSAADAAAAMQI